MSPEASTSSASTIYGHGVDEDIGSSNARQLTKGRFRRGLVTIAAWCRTHRHDPIREQHKALSAKLNGHYGYYGITGNAAALQRFRHRVQRIWHKWLSRRHNRPMLWERFANLLRAFPLPAAIAVHSALRRTAKP